MRRLKKIEKPLAGEARLLEDRTQGTALELSTMERDSDDSGTIEVSIVAVGTCGVVKKKACALKSSDDGCRRACRQAGHASGRLTRMRSVIGSPSSIGISSPCFWRLSR